MTGKSFGIGIVGGTSPFASSGYYLFLPASAGNTYQVIGIDNVADSSGTYSYTRTSSTLATVNLSVSTGGTVRGTLTFLTLSTGSFHVTTDAVPGAYQDGDFEMFSGAVPTSLSGLQVQCVVDDGSSPFGSSGSFTLLAAASGNTYSIVGDGLWLGNSSGTYAYSVFNATGKIQLSDSTSGPATAYLAFSDNTTGGYAVKSTASSGFQIGHFQLVTVSPPSTPTANPATSVSSAGFTANWSSTSGATGYRLDVSTSSAFSSYLSGYQDLDAGLATSRSLSGLSAGTTYYYRVRAYNSGGTSGNSSTITVITSPSAPPTLGFTKLGNNLVLFWPTAFSGFTLEFATNLPASSWTSNPAPPAIVNGQFAVTNTISGGQKFYRLKK